MPGALDVVLVILFAAVWPLLEYFWLWPRHLRAVAAGDPRARSRAYERTLVEQWALAGLVLALTFAFARPLASLGLRAPEGWRLWLGAGLVMLYLALMAQQRRVLASKPGVQTRLRDKLAPLRALLPHTPREWRRFVPLSVTAGICEELLFRGYLVWVLQAWFGLWPAALVSMVVFGLAHAYQGFKFGLRAFLAGIFMGLLALATRSILPGMALHALIDLGSGWIGYVALRGAPEAAEASAAGAA